MKKYIALFLGIIFVCFSCKKETIGVYEDANYVSFTTELADTSVMSFFFYSTDVVKYPLEVKLTGNMLTTDTEFSIVADEKTTLSKSLYEIPEKFVFRAGFVVDTVYITLNNDADLGKNQYLLQLSIKSGKELLSAKSQFTTKVMLISDKAEKPDWWTLLYDSAGNLVRNSVETLYLGPYTRLKYEAFIEATGFTDLGVGHDEMRRRSVTFLHWLRKQNPQLLDENGLPMVVPVIG